jgi:hypothetical protein
MQEQQECAMQNRPLPILVMSMWYLVHGSVSVIFGLLSSIVGTIGICFVPGMLSNGVLSIVAGVLNLLLAFSIWNGKDWARTAAMILGAIGVVVGVMGGAWLPVLVNIAVIVYMNTDGAKTYFASH